MGQLISLKNIAEKWKKKAVKKRALNLGFSDNPSGVTLNCHAIYWNKKKSVDLKNYHNEARASKDVAKFVDNPAVLFKNRGTNWEDILTDMLNHLKVCKPVLKFNTSSALKTLLSNANDGTVSEWLQGLKHEDQDEETSVTEKTFVVVLGTCPAITETHAIFCVFDSPVNLGQSMRGMRLLCLIISPVRSKQTKTGIEVGRTYATLLSNNDLRRKLIQCKATKDFAGLLKEECNRVQEEDAVKERELNHAVVQEEKHQHPVRKFFEEIMPPGKCLINDLRRRSGHYLSDYTDGLNDVTSIKKYISSIIFLYFSLLLPVIAFGVLNAEGTKQKIETRKGILSQAIGGILFAVFSGQPLSVVQTTIPVVLFTKLIYTFSVNLFNVDFLTFYTLTGLWNAFFLIIYSITGISKIMAFCSRSTEEIVGIFISIAFIVDSMKYVVKQFDKYWCFDDGNKYCDASVALAVFLVVFGTLFIGLQIFNFKSSPYLSATKRAIVAEYALPFSVLVMSFVGSYLLSPLSLGKFTDYEPQPPYKLFSIHPLKIDGCLVGSDENCESIGVGAFITTIGLGFIVSTLFFVEANVAASMVNSPHNKLKKGAAYHLDLFITAVVNIIMSVFGLPWMHACLPHSPMHVRSLADVEEKIEGGYVSEIVISVRETRLTNLIANGLIMLSVLMVPKPLEYIPTPALYGILLFISISSLREFQLWERILLLITEQNQYPPNYYIKKVPQKTIHLFTVLQILQILFLCGLSFSGFSYLKMLFPFIIISLIPIRKFLIPKVIAEAHLEALDGSH